MNKLTDVQWAWVAGLFEGEGHFRRAEGRSFAGLALGMTDEDVVRKLHNLVGVGSVYFEDREGFPNQKNLYKWVATKQSDCAAIIKAMLPHLGERRATAAREALSWIDGTHPARKRRTLVVGGECKHGHLLVGDAVRFVNRKGLPRQVVCKQCASAASARHRASKRA